MRGKKMGSTQKTKRLMNADIFQEKKENIVDVEKVSNIIPNKPHYVEHGIYFAESLKVFSDAEKTKPLIEGSDYEAAEIDSIASELSNKDCYRAVVFLKQLSEAYISYHSYGDIVTAEILNEVFDMQADFDDMTKKFKDNLDDLILKIGKHIGNTSPHGANAAASANTLALRTEAGTLKAAQAKAGDDLTPLSQVNSKIENTEIKLNSKIKLNRDSITGKLQAVSVEDFFQDTQDMSEAEQDKFLDSKIEPCGKFINAVRNSNGSLTVPEPKKEAEAANKKFTVDTVNKKIAELINNAPAELDTLKELADALNKNKDGISAINTALANRYTKAEADNIFTAKTGTYSKSEIDKKDKDTLEAAKTYLNSGIIDDVVEKSVKKIDGLSGSWKQECKTYTDSKVGSEAASRKTEDANTLSSAKNYTDKKTEQALLEHYTKYGYVQFEGMPAPHFINLLYYRWKQIRKFSIYIRLDNVSLSEKVTIWQLEYIPPSVQQ